MITTFVIQLARAGSRWEAVPPADWPTAPAQREIIMQDYDLSTPWGDRRQEIVFIGAGEWSVLLN